jgi:SH3-like domain-containing protein
MKRILAAIFILLLAFPAFAQEEAVKGFRDTDLPLPRWVSLKSDKVYVRAGPALRYPIKWIYRHNALPVEIIQEFENWRKVRDSEGDDGWVHQSLLSGERTVLIKTDDLTALRDKPEDNSRMVARLEPQVIAHLEKCEKAWCRLSAGGFRGWIERNSLWGIYESEELN